MNKRREPFTCAECQQTFTPVWTEEEAVAEAKANGFSDNPDNNVVVCDDCYQAIMGWAETNPVIAEAILIVENG